MKFEGTYSSDWRKAMDRTWNRGLVPTAVDKQMPGWRQTARTSKGIAQPWYERLEVNRNAPSYKR
ncbi:hypothetical protein EJP77_16050 [Paenibacillus zeisoli]|uniref:Uncharacterized protein n=1 Tax=Paenibacillus zeisoli TaxID=2496267 RepID=A0A433X4C9_9BACL|nr:hypothetical protein [Paenibacillus zeisoli]RUT28919.1 hypothetical protein EJP77_16050 [Paenibacillus zeisoli]